MGLTKNYDRPLATNRAREKAQFFTRLRRTRQAFSTIYKGRGGSRALSFGPEVCLQIFKSGLT